MNKYLKVKSVTWWAGVALALVQVVRAAGVELPGEIDKVIIAIGGIGLRGAIAEGKK